MAIRQRFLKMHFEARSGHIGTGLSCIDILTYLYRCWLKTQDIFILSKGHGASALYATLNYIGLLSDELLKTYYQDGTKLPAHPAALALPYIPIATGSLGHGLSVGAGMAYTHHHWKKSNSRVVCLLSDGECNEGSVWEAALFLGHHRLKNLTVVIDKNGLQGFGRTEQVLNTAPLASKWASFGFDVRETSGHLFSELDQSFQWDGEKPLCIIAETVKGKGVSFMENKLEWHYQVMDPDQFQRAWMENVQCA